MNNRWVKSWGTQPYNLVQVKLHRSGNAKGDNDGPLPLFLGPFVNKSNTNVAATSTAAMLPASGFQSVPSQPGVPAILPIALDERSWKRMISGKGSDEYRWNETAKTISAGSDGILEINLIPDNDVSVPEGNRGTLDFGEDFDEASIARQIRYGLSSRDMRYFDRKISFARGPLNLTGETGFSAGLNDALRAALGQPRAIPLFSQVTSSGSRAVYRVVRFVGIRIVDVNLSGANRRLIIQPAPVSSRNAIPGAGSIRIGTVVTAPMLID